MLYAAYSLSLSSSFLWRFFILSKCFHTEFAESPLKNISEVRCQAAGCRDSLRNFSLEAYRVCHPSLRSGSLVDLWGIIRGRGVHRLVPGESRGVLDPSGTGCQP